MVASHYLGLTTASVRLLTTCFNTTMLITRKRFLTISGLTICSLAFTSQSYAADPRWESPTRQGQNHFDPMELSGQVDFYKGDELNRIVINMWDH
jgi:hypothetical protein